MDGSVLVMGLTNVSLKGDMVTFICSSGLILTGPNISTCMGNGKWEPDPREIACKRKNHSTYIIKKTLINGNELAGYMIHNYVDNQKSFLLLAIA